MGRKSQFLPSCKRYLQAHVPREETNYSPSISRNCLIIYLLVGAEEGEVHICFAFITYLHSVLLLRLGNAIGATHVISVSFIQLLFFCCWSFFFPLSPSFFLRLEQIQCDWQKIGRLQRSRGSDFSSK